MNVELTPITDDNKAACTALKVSSEQAKYISRNTDSLKEAEQVPKVARPFLICADGEPVGFTMFAFDEDNDDPHDRCWLWRFMIDERFQGKGYGKAALSVIIDYFTANNADEITLSTKPDNTAALSLYRKIGFRENGDMNDGEIVLMLYLRKENL